MTRRHAVRLVAAVAGGAVLVTVASAGVGRARSQTPRVGGKVVVGLHFEPTNLNPYLETSAPSSRAEVVDRVLDGAYSLTGRGDLVPNLIVGDPKVATRPFSLTYTIKKDARWSDGRSITARDFWFTWRTLRKLNRTLPEGERFTEGELIAKAKILDRRKVRFVLRKPWGGWRDFFFYILPWHALAGEDFKTVWRDRIDNPKSGRAISSGPFIFASWRRGSTLTLKRNPNYWGRKAYLDRLDFRAAATTGFSEKQALLSRKVDLITGATKADVDELRHRPRIRIKSGSTNGWEHLDFQLGAKGNPALKKPFVRRAIALAIDRKALTSFQAKELAAVKTLESALFARTHPAYQPHWRRWNHRPKDAIRLLHSNGCRRAPDGIFSCAGKRLSFRVLSTAGFPSREVEFAALMQQLRRVGIELRKDFAKITVVFGTTGLLAQGDWDLALFAWITGPDPVGWENVYGCNGTFNQQAYCNREVTRLLRSASAALRTRRRWALANRADALIARDLATVPLFHQSGLIAYDSRIRNIRCCVGIAWNAENWWLARR